MAITIGVSMEAQIKNFNPGVTEQEFVAFLEKGLMSLLLTTAKDTSRDEAWTPRDALKFIREGGAIEMDLRVFDASNEKTIFEQSFKSKEIADKKLSVMNNPDGGWQSRRISKEDE